MFQRLRLWGIALVIGLFGGNGDRLAAQIFATGGVMDLAVDGAGWFVLRNPASAQQVATRLGHFYLDASGYVLSPEGARLQGYNSVGLTNLGDLRVDSAGSLSTADVASFTVAADSKIHVLLTDGTEFVRGQILLQHFSAPEKLSRVAYQRYLITPAAGALAQMAVPGTAGLGTILSGYLDLTPEPVRLSVLPDATECGPLAEGVLTSTGIRNDLGIAGPGFFLVRDPNTSELLATRVGMFLRDGDGYLITYDRLRVQGLADAALTTPGDVRIDETGSPPAAPGAVFTAMYLGGNGQVTVRLSDGTEFVRGQVLLYSFQHPERLVPTNLSHYAAVAAAGPVVRAAGDVLGDGIREGRLELINVTADLLALRRDLNFINQGYLTMDDIATHLALVGPGYFAVRNPVTGANFATRSGAFLLDASNRLVTANGLRVQGFCDAALTTQGDLCVDAAGAPGGVTNLSVAAFSFASDGRLRVRLADGTEFIRGQILLRDFREPFLLRAGADGVYTNMDIASPLPPAVPDLGTLGLLVAGALETLLPIPELQLPARQGFRLHITGDLSGRWRLQAATNLTDWTTLKVTTNAPDEIEFTDVASGGYARRFYRLAADMP